MSTCLYCSSRVTGGYYQRLALVIRMLMLITLCWLMVVSNSLAAVVDGLAPEDSNIQYSAVTGYAGPNCAFLDSPELIDSRELVGSPELIDSRDSLRCHRQVIKDFLLKWVNVWAAGNIEAYLNFYVAKVSPRAGLDYRAWQAQRRRLIGGRNDINIKLELQSMLLTESGITEVIFIQRYHSLNYSDKVVKKLSLVSKDRTFEILTEQVLSSSRH
ncbi:MAG: hypothetical protein KUG79_18645 [Pseudomonadales bacterium]|nr:hypothetical protein [Pseudomonadales bacterium]